MRHSRSAATVVKSGIGDEGRMVVCGDDDVVMARTNRGDGRQAPIVDVGRWTRSSRNGAAGNEAATWLVS